MKKMNYWQSRIEKQEDLDEVLLINKMTKLYKDAIKDIKAMMNALYADLVADNFSRSVDLYNYARYYDRIEAINARLVKMGQKAEGIVEPALLNMYGEVQTILDASAPDRIKEAFVMPGRADEVIKSVWCGDGKNWSQRIWGNVDKLKDEVERGLRECWVQGKTTDDWNKRLVQEFGVSLSRAATLSRTELAFVAKQSQMDRYAAAGIKQVKIETAHDSRVCVTECDQHDGELVDLLQAQIGVNIPPFHPNCRCIITPVVGG